MKPLAMIVIVLSIFVKLYVKFLMWTGLGSIFW